MRVEGAQRHVRLWKQLIDFDGFANRGLALGGPSGSSQLQTRVRDRERKRVRLVVALVAFGVDRAPGSPGGLVDRQDSPTEVVAAHQTHDPRRLVVEEIRRSTAHDGLHADGRVKRAEEMGELVREHRGRTMAVQRFASLADRHDHGEAVERPRHPTGDLLAPPAGGPDQDIRLADRHLGDQFLQTTLDRCVRADREVDDVEDDESNLEVPFVDVGNALHRVSKGRLPIGQHPVPFVDGDSHRDRANVRRLRDREPSDGETEQEHHRYGKPAWRFPEASDWARHSASRDRTRRADASARAG